MVDSVHPVLQVVDRGRHVLGGIVHLLHIVLHGLDITLNTCRMVLDGFQRVGHSLQIILAGLQLMGDGRHFGSHLAIHVGDDGRHLVYVGGK